VIFNDVTIEEGATVVDSVLMPGSIVRSGVHISRAIVAPHTKVQQSIQGGTTIALVNQ
jgi:glucose-1-phosphate adenylyltransferase